MGAHGVVCALLGGLHEREGISTLIRGQEDCNGCFHFFDEEVLPSLVL